MSPPISTPSAEPHRAAPRPSLRQRAGEWAVAWLAGAVCIVVAAAAIMQSGVFDITATTPHDALIGWVVHNTMIHSVKLRAGSEPDPKLTSRAQLDHGFALYDIHCVMCHGAPGVPRAAWTTGLTPTPPYLLDSARTWRGQELRQIIDKGVKMTAMPAWGLSLSGQDVDDLVLWVKALPTITPQDYARRRAAKAPSEPPRNATSPSAPPPRPPPPVAS